MSWSLRSKRRADARDAVVGNDFVDLEPRLLGLGALVVERLFGCGDAGV
jgi:hypothetical protein